MTFETGSGAGLSITPPGIIVGPPMRLASRTGRGVARRSRGRACRGPCRTGSVRGRPCALSSMPPLLEHLRSQADDLHEVLLAQLAGDGPEDARAARVALRVDDHRRVLVERDLGAVVAPERLLRADD